jgi:5-methyltetrahydropteroyltriglutamate--homocysteine methyltransferase
MHLIGLDSTHYDQVLDMCFTLGLIPPRFEKQQGLDQYFAMARGAEGVSALDMSKYFNTNYHYLVCIQLVQLQELYAEACS